MRFCLILAAALSTATTVTAATAHRLLPRQIPSCATNCLLGSNVDYFGCSSTDDNCLCHSSQFINTSTACIQSSCSGNDLATAEQFAQSLCAAVGVTLTSLTPSATASGSSASSSGASASTTSASTSSAASSSSTAKSGASSNHADVAVGVVAVALGAAVAML